MLQQFKTLHMPQRELIHDLVDRSRERVVHVRAGNSLHRVLQNDALTHSLSSSSSLPCLPPAPPMAIMPRHSLRKATERTDGTKDQRRRAALPLLAPNALHLPEEASAFDQYQQFMDSKVYREETLHQRQRRVAIAPRADLLKKLAVVCATALEEMEKETNAPAVRESLREKLLRAIALLRGGKAFANAKMLPPPPPPAYAEIKNAHLAFLEFKREGVSPTKEKRIHPSAGLQDVNTSSKTPIRFGDQICLLSALSNVPLAIGPDGRSRAALDSSAGPHMTFAIVDFRNPSRHDEVTGTDDFWLRVDPTFVAPRKHLNHQRLYFDHENLDQAGGGDEDDDLTSLLNDTNYYLGCPGWLDDDEHTGSASSTNDHQKATANGHHSYQRFRLVAMKALTPAKLYYGDDAATREYSIETNESIMRLARWRFLRYTPRRHEQQVRKAYHHGTAVGSGSSDDTEDINNALVNCSTVYLVLSDFALTYDKLLKRGVGVSISSDERAASKEVLRVSDHQHKKKAHSRHHINNGGAAAKVAKLSDCARWQVRILQRNAGTSHLQELESAITALSDEVRKEDGERVEWLRKKQEKLVANERKVHASDEMVRKARQQYDLVAVESNCKLEQIERQKAAQGPEYFQRRLQVLKSIESSHQPHELAQLMHQQLQRVVELPRL